MTHQILVAAAALDTYRASFTHLFEKSRKDCTDYSRVPPVTLFIMSELITNAKLATAGPWHFELQKYPPKENYKKKMVVSPRIQTWDK